MTFREIPWLNSRDSCLFQTDRKALQDYIELFTDCYKDLIDVDFNHLKDG